MKIMVYAPSRRFYPTTTFLTKNLIVMYDIQILEEIILKSNIDRILYLVPDKEDKRLYKSVENSLIDFVNSNKLVFEHWDNIKNDFFLNTNLLLTDVSKIAYFYILLTFNYSILYLPFLQDKDLNIYKNSNFPLIICNNLDILLKEVENKVDFKNHKIANTIFEGLL